MVKRDSIRVRVRDNYRARIVVADDTMIKNISLSGICIKTSKYIAYKESYRVHLISHNNEEIMPKGVVVRSILNDSIERNGDTMPVYDVALKFLQLTNREKHFVREMINHTMSFPKHE
jgi:hypothetical protein